MAEGQNKRWGLRALISGAVAAWLIYDMASATEAPSQALAILHYVLLALLLISFVCALWKYFTAD